MDKLSSKYGGMLDCLIVETSHGRDVHYGLNAIEKQYIQVKWNV